MFKKEEIWKLIVEAQTPPSRPQARKPTWGMVLEGRDKKVAAYYQHRHNNALLEGVEES